MKIWILILAFLIFPKLTIATKGSAGDLSGCLPTVAREEGLDARKKKHPNFESQKVSRFSLVQDSLISWENEEEERLLRVLEEMDHDLRLEKAGKVSKQRRRKTGKRKKRYQEKSRKRKHFKEVREFKGLIENTAVESHTSIQKSNLSAKNPGFCFNSRVTNENTRYQETFEEDTQFIESNQASTLIKAKEFRSSSGDKVYSDHSNDCDIPKLKPTSLQIENIQHQYKELNTDDSVKPTPRHKFKSSSTPLAHTIPLESFTNGQTVSRNDMDGVSQIHPHHLGMPGAMQQRSYQFHSSENSIKLVQLMLLIKTHQMVSHLLELSQY
jgi:hypothetical protein